MSSYNKASQTENKYVLYLRLLEYEDIIREPHLIEQLSELLKEYSSPGMSFQDYGSHLAWQHILVSNTLLMITEPNNQIQQVVEDAISIEIELASIGILVTGELAYGNCQTYGQNSDKEQPRIFTGEVFSDIFKTERLFAEYPRILIDEIICEGYLSYERFVKKTNIKGIYFLDYIHPYTSIKTSNGYYSFLQEMRGAIRKGLAKYSYQRNERYVQDLDGYLWLKHYYQGNLNDFDSSIREDLAI